MNQPVLTVKIEMHYLPISPLYPRYAWFYTQYLWANLQIPLNHYFVIKSTFNPIESPNPHLNPIESPFSICPVA